MCGIITIMHPSRPVDNKILIERFIAQRGRGTEGFGFTYLTPKGYLKTQRFEDEAMCFYALAAVSSKLIMLHHRRPTSTKNNISQNHPISCKTETAFYSMVHNGVIANDKDVKEIHNKEENIKYSTEDEKSFNDSETLLHELVRNIETQQAIRCYGSIAFVLLVADKKRKFLRLHYGRNNNPLYHVRLKDDTHVISSQNDMMEIKDMSEVNMMHTIQIDKNEIKILPKFPTVFPTYTDLNPTPAPRYGQRSLTASGESSSGRHFQHPFGTGATKLADGSVMAPGSTKAAGIKRNAHEQYIDCLQLAEGFVMELDGGMDAKDEFETQGLLKDIDATIADCRAAKQTRRIERAIEALVAHRLRLLPKAPSSHSGILTPGIFSQLGDRAYSLFRRQSIANGDHNSGNHVIAPPVVEAPREEVKVGQFPKNARIGNMSQEEFNERLKDGYGVD